MIHVKGEPVMGIETKPHDQVVSEIHDAPSIAPHREHVFDNPLLGSKPRVKPQFHITVSRESSVGRSRMSVMDIAKNIASVVGLVAGFGLYLVVILSVMAASLCWMPFSRSDGTS